MKDTSGRLHYIDVYSDSDNNDVSEGTGNEETDGYDQEKSLFKSIKENDYVVVKFCTKKTVKHYLGKVEFCDRGFEYLVKFLRKVSENKFVFPESEDRSLVNCDEIVSVLPPPSNSKRGGQYIFNIDLLKYTNLG